MSAPRSTPAPVGQATALLSPERRLTTLGWLPASLLAFVLVTGLCASQGGYFPDLLGARDHRCVGRRPRVARDGSAHRCRLARCLACDLADVVRRLGGTLRAVVGSACAHRRGISTRPRPRRRGLRRPRPRVAGRGSITLVRRHGRHRRNRGLQPCDEAFPGQLDVFDPAEGYRLSGLIGYWNGLGTLAAIGIVLAAGIAVDAQGGWQRITASVALVILAPTLYFTASRGAAVALTCGLLAMLAVTPRRVRASEDLSSPRSSTNHRPHCGSPLGRSHKSDDEPR